MTERLTLAVPSKGRLMEQTSEKFAAAGLELRKVGSARGYRGEIAGIDAIDVAFISASEIAQRLKSGDVHMGITGEDLLRELMADADERVVLEAGLGFGRADVVVAVPTFWLDVATMADLGEMALPFRRAHGRWIRVATKYVNLTRRFFASRGVADYRIVESLGATEGTPAAGTADLIVDITTTGATLAANGLRILDDGVILRSEANLVTSRGAPWSSALEAARTAVVAALAGAKPRA